MMKKVIIYQDAPLTVEETFSYHDDVNITTTLELHRVGMIEHTGLSPITPKKRVTLYARVNRNEVIFTTEPSDLASEAGFIEAPAESASLKEIIDDAVTALNGLWSNDYYTIYYDDEGLDPFYGSLAECINHCVETGVAYEVEHC